MSKFSVKKPLTIFVIVVAILVLGVVAFTRMTPDLFPNMDFPYVVIVTTYPGASPEKVEAEVTKPLEQSMSTLEHIVEVSSNSSENVSMVMLEFEEDVNMDTIGVDIQQQITALSASWDDMVGAPYVLKINPSVLPVEVAAVSMEGMDTVQLTEFLDDTLMNKLEGIPGVARISTSGAINQQLHVVLDQQLIDKMNQQIADGINGKIDEAASELQEKKQELEDAQTELEDAKEKLDAGKDALLNQTAQAGDQIDDQKQQLEAARAELEAQLDQLKTAEQQLQTSLAVLQALQNGVDELDSQIATMEKEIDSLRALQQQIQDLQARQAAFDAQIAQLRANTEMTAEEIEAAVEAIYNSADYIQLQAEKEVLNAQLAAQGLTPENIGTRIEQQQAIVDGLKDNLADLEEALAAQGLGREALKTQIAELEAAQAELAAGKAAIEDGLKQMDEGMLQLEDAQELLDEKRTEGLVQLSKASAELVANSTAVADGLVQLESGLETVEASREEALSQVDLNKLLTLEMLSQILVAQNFSMPAGYVEQDGVSYMVSVGDQITTQDDLENLLLFDLGVEGVAPIYLKDVAVVTLTDNRNETYAKLDGLDSIVLSFEKQSTYATAETTDNITQRFEELEEEYPGLSFQALMNQGDYIYIIVQSILSSLLLGALFSMIVLLLFLRDIRPTVITLCSIPISVIFAFVLMYFSGVTLNMISLSGLAVAVGMLVDNSVVVIENIYRLRAKGATVLQAAVSGAKQVAGAVVSSTLTTVCVFLPIVFVEGITRQLFTDLALTMTYALLASLIVSLTLVPAMASGLLRKEKVHKPGLLDKIMPAYEKAIGWSIRHKAIVLIASAVLLAVTAFASLRRGFIFMPEMDMSSVTVNVTMPENTTMEEAVALSDEVLDRIDDIEGIETVGAMMGGSGLLGGGGESHNVTVYITLSDKNASGAKVGRQIEQACKDMACEVKASSAMLDMNMLAGSGISLNIYADDMQKLQNAAIEAAKALEGIEGLTEISNGLEDATPALHVKIDPNDAMKQGITVAQVYMELATALTDSATVATLELDGTSTSVIIQKQTESQLDVDALKNYEFLITGFDGTEKTVKLSDFAQLEETTSLASIARQGQRRYLSVSAQLKPGYNVTVLTSEAERVMKKVDLGDGVSYVFAGENETIMESIRQLGLMLLLGILLVYLVMVAQFQSLKSPFIVMFTIPLAFTGGFLALIICGMEVSVVSLIGFVLLVGIIVNNGIVLVDYINQLRKEGMERRAAIIEAGKTRLRPILMTSVTTILGLMDMAIRRSPGTAMVKPMAIVCIGGLIYATLMTLFVVPCIYDMMNKKELRNVRDEELEFLE